MTLGPRVEAARERGPPIDQGLRQIDWNKRMNASQRGHRRDTAPVTQQGRRGLKVTNPRSKTWVDTIGIASSKQSRSRNRR